MLESGSETVAPRQNLDTALAAFIIWGTAWGNLPHKNNVASIKLAHVGYKCDRGNGSERLARHSQRAHFSCDTVCLIWCAFLLKFYILA